MNHFLRLIIIAIAFSTLAGPAIADSVSGRVVGVTDGDTFTLLTENEKQLKVRVAEIDAPERGQAYGKKSHQALAGLVFKKEVTIDVQVIDKYGRLVGRPIVGGRDISAEMLRLGAAWVYRTYCDDPKMYEIEKQAKEQQTGLWGMPEHERVPPWEWRRGKRNNSTGNPMQNAFECGAKSYCGEMVSCEEAKYHLQSCGLTQIDGDNDGVPCESICR